MTNSVTCAQLWQGHTFWFATEKFGHRYELILESVLHVQLFLDISVPGVVTVDVLDSETGTPLLIDLAIAVDKCTTTQTKHILQRVEEQLLHFADFFAVDKAVVMDQ